MGAAVDASHVAVVRGRSTPIPRGLSAQQPGTSRRHRRLPGPSTARVDHGAAWTGPSKALKMIDARSTPMSSCPRAAGCTCTRSPARLGRPRWCCCTAGEGPRRATGRLRCRHWPATSVSLPRTCVVTTWGLSTRWWRWSARSASSASSPSAIRGGTVAARIGRRHPGQVEEIVTLCPSRGIRPRRLELRATSPSADSPWWSPARTGSSSGDSSSWPDPSPVPPCTSSTAATSPSPAPMCSSPPAQACQSVRRRAGERHLFSSGPPAQGEDQLDIQLHLRTMRSKARAGRTRWPLRAGGATRSEPG